MLKLHRTRDQTLHLEKQNSRKLCRKKVSLMTFKRETKDKNKICSTKQSTRQKDNNQNMTLHYPAAHRTFSTKTTKGHKV